MSEPITSKQIRITRGFQVLTLEPTRSETAESILQQLNDGQARLVRGEINVYHAPPAEGYYTIATVVASEDNTPKPGPWQLFQEPIVHSHDGACCAKLSKADEERGEAIGMARTAYRCISEADLELGRQLLDVAINLYDRHGDRINVDGMWLTTIEAAILEAEGKTAEAEAKFREAVEQAEKACGTGHPSHLITQGNLGETLCKAGKLDEGKPMLQAALDGIKAATPEGNFDADYLAAAVTNLTETLAKFL